MPDRSENYLTTAAANVEAKTGMKTAELFELMSGLGDFEVSPKKTYVVLRTKKRNFACVGPGSKGRLELVGYIEKAYRAAS